MNRASVCGLLFFIGFSCATAQSPVDREYSVDELKSKMERGEITSHALVQSYLDRIAAITSRYGLTTRVTGPGRVTSRPDGLRCGSDLA